MALMIQFSFAQEKTITGTVTSSEDGQPLLGVNVIVKGTTRGQQTDFDGNYTIRAAAGETLVFSFVGLKTVESVVGASNTINITMESDAAQLSEVVVTGYATTTKTKSSIASVTVTAETIENRPNASFVQTLQGQVPGLNITTQSGQPGGNSLINLRGITSINGNTEPLFIMDGAPIDEDNFRSLNPNDIASISVLKDAAATAIYGNRGANGVIVIKTRGGSFNSGLKINYNGFVSFSSLQDDDYDLLTSPEQLQLEADTNRGLGATLTPAEIANRSTFNWDEFFFDTAVTQSHNLTLSSGSENASQFTSIGFNETEGILINSNLRRFNLRTNVTGKTSNDRFNYGLNLTVNFSQNDEPNAIGTGGINRNFVLGAYQSVPYLNPGDYTNGADLLSPLSFTNTPLFLIDLAETFTREEDEVRLIGSLNAGYKITDWLTANVVLSADYNSEFLLRAEAPDSFNALLFGGGANPTSGFQDQDSNRTFTYNQVTSLNFSKEFGKHSVNGGLYTEYFKGHFLNFGFFAQGLNGSTFFPGDGSGFVGDNANNDFFIDFANANLINIGLFSYFANVDYDYDTRYGFSGSIRRDASSRFASTNRYGTFWSVAGRWNISNEQFFQDSGISSVVNSLKLRVSYGTSGNQRITGGRFGGVDLAENFFQTGGGFAGNNSIFLSQIGNNTLEWETVEQANIGLDFALFNNRLRGSFDVYEKKTTDLFQNTPISSINSISNLQANTGDLFNRGVDLQLDYDIIRSNGDGFNLGVNFVGNYNKTEIENLPSITGEILGGGFTSLRNGGLLNEYFVIRYSRVNPANGNLLFLDANGNETETPDADTDRVWLDESINPEFTGSIGFNADYKGFYITTQWNYAIGGVRNDGDLAIFQNDDSIGQFRHTRDLLRAWTPTNTETDIPRLFATNRNGITSTRYFEKTDYIRLRFASIGYNVPTKFLEGTGLNSVKLFANGENILTITDWRGFDVEALTNTTRQFPTPQTFSVGVELGF